IKYLLTNMNAFHNRVSMHGVRRELIEAQASAMNIPLLTIELPEEPSMTEYEEAMMKQLNWILEQGIRTSIFGDIFLEDLKDYRENKLRTIGMDCVFPLWKKDTSKLMQEFLEAGFKAIVVCVNEEKLNESFCGRRIDESFCRDLPADVD